MTMGENLKRFINDPLLVEAVRSTLSDIFLRPPKNTDVQSLAAAWMAKDTFNKAWEELMSYRTNDMEPKVASQIGL